MTAGFNSHAVRVTAIVPVLNAIRFLPRTIPSVLEAARTTRDIEIICIDNGSTDGSFEYLLALANEGLCVHQRVGVSISALRNFGAELAHGEFLSFLDADCSIAKNYFDEALSVLHSTQAAATGYKFDLPMDPHWIETTWHKLHSIDGPHEVKYLNGGNFFISRKVFQEIGGFREELRTGEDAELGQRLTHSRYRIVAAPNVAAVHLGNPKSVRDFYRRNVWHGLGMFGTVNLQQVDKPTAMMMVHLLATIGGLIFLVAAPFGWPVRALIASVLQFLVPTVTVAYRVRRSGRATHLVKGIGLYWIYYWARLEALVRIIVRGNKNYAK